MSLSVITTKTPFLSNLLISLYYKSIKGVSCTKTNIFIGGGCLADIFIEISIPCTDNMVLGVVAHA